MKRETRELRGERERERDTSVGAGSQAEKEYRERRGRKRLGVNHVTAGGLRALALCCLHASAMLLAVIN